jgi:hypothetical protein
MMWGGIMIIGLEYTDYFFVCYLLEIINRVLCIVKSTSLIDSVSLEFHKLATTNMCFVVVGIHES